MRKKRYKTEICLLSRGIEWTSLTSFLSFAASTPNNMGLVRNELQLVDLPTGLCRPTESLGWSIPLMENTVCVKHAQNIFSHLVCVLTSCFLDHSLGQ